MNAEFGMRNAESAECGLVACRDEQGEVLKVIQLVPDGHVVSLKGDILVDAACEAPVKAAFAEHGTDLPIDYEHQTLGGAYSSPDGTAPAAGWVKDLSYQPGRGILAAVEWTDRAREMIRNKEYRYLSPVVLFDKRSRRVLAIHSAAMTNKPAIRRMETLAASENNPHKEKTKMAEEPQGVDPGTGMARIAEALSVPDQPDMGALIQACLERVRDLVKKAGAGEEKKEEGDATGSVASKALIEALGLKDGADENAVMVAVNSLKGADGAVQTMQKELLALKETMATRDADERMAPYMADGRINPNDKEDLKVCKALAAGDPEGFEHQMQRRRPDPAPGKTTPPGGKPGGGDNRETLIASAGRDFDAGGTEGRLTDRRSFVDQTLRDAGRGPMTDDEFAATSN